MEAEIKPGYFPILIDLSQFPALVIGGGRIAYRKIMNLLEFGAKPDVIAPQICPEIAALEIDKNIRITKRKYQTGDLEGYTLVFVATGDEAADRQIFEDNKETQALLNVGDVPDLCNFIMPSIVRRGALTIAISSQGKAPFYVAEQRRRLEQILSPMTADVVELAGEFRQKLLAGRGAYDPDRQYELFRKFLTMDWEAILYEHGKDEARRMMEGIFTDTGI